jgi:hypothetical protein
MVCRTDWSHSQVGSDADMVLGITSANVLQDW